MRVNPICIAIRFVPIGVLFAVHCSSGHWPSDGECAERVMRDGFSVELFRMRPLSVLTHLLVHVSSDHLLRNALMFAATLIEFGDTYTVQRRSDDVEEGDAEAMPASQRQDSMPAQLRALWGERSPLQACVRTIGAFTVWMLGGALGGLGGQLLYNNSTVALRRERATRAALAVCASQQSAAEESGAGVLATLTRHARILHQRMEALNASFAADAQEAVNDAMLMCGASAGICALSGFNAVYYRRPLTAVCVVVPEMVVLSMDLLNHYVALLGAPWGLSGISKQASQQAVIRSTWRMLMPGQTVGHAAHVGGFVVGAGMGWGLLWVQRCRLRHAPACRRAHH
ncbi:putative serine peptidase Clan S- family S54 [Leptomonas seymouri]|uniref:Putative serine peptidase Clan S-family S54 n=1 Tax=Leptomonas seymouri TaxID=5684 RepID=A0A0N1IG61_LEPSE|nr:putative serine peptidase Clan S- family S54 [Leptomonas seymouri]|eukprot:KPI82695.1 putative serine peptidase Clan S- family S54 [Leptomonas seymouri]